MKRKVQLSLDIFLTKKPMKQQTACGESATIATSSGAIKQTMTDQTATTATPSRYVNVSERSSSSNVQNLPKSAQSFSTHSSNMNDKNDKSTFDRNFETSDPIESLSQSLKKATTRSNDNDALLQPSQSASSSTSRISKLRTYGTDLCKFTRTASTVSCLTLEECKDKPDFVVLLPTDSSATATAEEYEDRWDSDFVRFPCSRHNLYPVVSNDGEKLVNRWQMINEALTAPIRSSTDLEEAILSYNGRYAAEWNFNGLHSYINRFMNNDERRKFFDVTLPSMIQLALALPKICPKPIPLLKQRTNRTLILSQRQAACLLANAFLCTYPRRNAIGGNRHRSGPATEYENYPKINFSSLFGSGRLNREKLRFLLHYFERVVDKMPDGLLSFQRKYLTELPDWNESDALFTDLHVSATGTIEDFGTSMLQVDFANKFLGGGVLGHGSVQEEIRFLINPELIISMLFTEFMLPNESIIITGSERFSCYMGYGSETLEWSAPYFDTTERDKLGRRRTEIVAIDAVPFNSGSSVNKQFSPGCMIRELNKAFCGFHCPTRDQKIAPNAVATGNWGCGAFGGNKELKSLIQLMAAAQTGRDVVYFTFGDEEFAESLYYTYLALKSNNITVGRIMITLRRYYETEIKNKKLNQPENENGEIASPVICSLFDFLRNYIYKDA